MKPTAVDLLARGMQSSVFEWTERDFSLYALSLGLGREAARPDLLEYVLEGTAKVVPTFPTTVAWISNPTFTSLGVDPLYALHGEQRIEVHQPITRPLSARVESRVSDVRDKGVGRGAIITLAQHVTDRATGTSIATLTTTCFGRREGGCGSAGVPPPALVGVPLRDPDATVLVPTAVDLALLYRLTGDGNPLHSDPDVARAAGFERPILHGLCGFGITCAAVLRAFPDVGPDAVAAHEARFASPVYPGDTLAIDLWRDLDGVSFRARVPERHTDVITHGRTRLRGTGLQRRATTSRGA